MKKTIGRDLPDGTYVEIEAEERGDGGVLSPGFAIILNGWEQRGTRSGRTRARSYRNADHGGADHATILRVAPELGPIVDVDLADPDGTPMHALANGWYFYTGESREYELDNYGQEYVDRMGTDLERAARALHIPVMSLPRGMDKDRFTQFVASLANYWQAQANRARQVLEAMVDGDGVVGGR